MKSILKCFLRGKRTVSGGEAIPTEFVDWTTWSQSTTNGGVPQKTGAPTYISSAGGNEISLTLAAGRHVFTVASPITNGGFIDLDVGGVAATVLAESVAGTESYAGAFVYDVPSAGTYTVAISPRGVAQWLNPALSIHKVDNAATVTASAGAAPSVTASGQDVIFASMTVNQPQYAPDGSSEFVVNAAIDIRSDENYLLRQYTGISSNITADASYPAAATTYRTVTVEIS